MQDNVVCALELVSRSREQLPTMIQNVYALLWENLVTRNHGSPHRGPKNHGVVQAVVCSIALNKETLERDGVVCLNKITTLHLFLPNERDSQRAHPQLYVRQ